MISMLRSLILIMFMINSYLATLASSNERVNYRFRLDENWELVSVFVNRPTNPIRVPLELVLSLNRNGEMVDELLFQQSLSAIWRVSPEEFLVLLGPETLHVIRIENNKLIDQGFQTIPPFGEPTFGTSINRNLIFKFNGVLLYYDNYDKESFRLRLEKDDLEKEVTIGLKYPSLIDSPSFTYPPHRSIRVEGSDVFILDERNAEIHVFGTDEFTQRKIPLEQGFDYKWDYYSNDLMLIKVDANGIETREKIMHH